jgi:hypothetical protein
VALRQRISNVLHAADALNGMKVLDPQEKGFGYFAVFGVSTQ